MALTPPPDETDVVVIGAGMSGLVAGALLSKAGLNVTVVESELRPGGYLAGFRRKQFIFDSAIHWLNQCGPGGMVHRMLAHIGPVFPYCKPLTEIRRLKGDTFDVRITSTPDDLKAEWIERFPEDKAGIERFFKDAWIIGGRMNSFADHMRSTESMSWMEYAFRGMKLAWWGIPFMTKYKLTAEEGLDKYFTNPWFKKVFATEHDFMSILVPIGWAYHLDFQSPPAGGSQAFPEWLVKQIESRGSKVVLNRRVKQVLVEDGVSQGVVLEGKTRKHAADVPEHTIRSKYVICTGDVVTLYENMLPKGAVDESFIEKLKNAELYPSSLTISLGLDCTAESLGFDEAMWMLTHDDVSRDEQAETDPDRCAITILAPTTRDRTMAPEGKGTLTVYTSAEIHYGDTWKTGPGYARGPEYKAFKQDYADKIIDRIERTLDIDLRSHIEVQAIATPITHWRYTGNRFGSIMGGRPSKPNMKAKLAHYHTQVKNLYLGGHWAEYGGGVPVATRAGANTALLILKQENTAEYRALCDVMDGKSVPTNAPLQLTLRAEAPVNTES